MKAERIERHPPPQNRSVGSYDPSITRRRETSVKYGTKIHPPWTYLSTKGEDMKHARRRRDISQFAYAYYTVLLAGEEVTSFVYADEMALQGGELCPCNGFPTMWLTCHDI